MLPIDVIESWINNSPIPIVIFNADRLIIWKNGAFEKFIGENIGFRVAENRLFSSASTTQKELDRIFSDTSISPNIYIICTEGECPDYIARVYSVGTDDKHFLVMFRSARVKRAFHLEELKRARKLTSSEAEVLGLVLHGVSIRDIAAARGSSVETIRKHIAKLNKKLDVKSQGSLVVAAMALCTRNLYF